MKMPDTINGKTPEEIKKGLECCTIPDCEGCPYDDDPSCVVKNADALAYIQQLEERNERLEYTLCGVMHSIDKWLDAEPYDFDKDDGTEAATRASNSREVALKAIEQLETRIAQAERERDAAVKVMSLVRLCENCKHCDKSCESYPCSSCSMDRERRKPNWEWRGVCTRNTKKEENHA